MPTPEVYDDQWSDPSAMLELKRDIQKHFLQYKLYLPVEDMVAGIGEIEEQRTADLMRSACGSADLYVWVPVRIRMPLIGDRIHEWCWKPKIRKL